jgi:DNA sulfur modification protein DndB
MEIIIQPCIRVKQERREFLLSKLTADVLAKISYASVLQRGAQEEGAVQRILDRARIEGITKFVQAGGDYPSCIILNWVSTSNPLTVENGNISFTIGTRLAQLVDGQHRVEGLREAMKSTPSVKDREIPIAIYQNLNTNACADIFISINDKQKRVPKSIVVDLYGVASDYLVDPVNQRARDLAEILNEDDKSPYHSLIRYANEPRNKFGIPISTVVDAIKPLVEPQGGIFDQVGLNELNMQKGCIVNFFTVLKKWYGKHWESKSNVFLTSAGFVGATDFLKLHMLAYCNLSKDFTVQNIENAMHLDTSALIDRELLKGKQGRASWTLVNSELKARFFPPKSDVEIKY